MAKENKAQIFTCSRQGTALINTALLKFQCWFMDTALPSVSLLPINPKENGSLHFCLG